MNPNPFTSPSVGEEPPCAQGYTHTWCAPLELVGGNAENPGMAWVPYPENGRLVVEEVCVHCGRYRTSSKPFPNNPFPDKAFQGEANPKEEVTYWEADLESREWVEQELLHLALEHMHRKGIHKANMERNAITYQLPHWGNVTLETLQEILLRVDGRLVVEDRGEGEVEIRVGFW